MMVMMTTDDKKRPLSIWAIIVCGVICATLLLASFFTIRHIRAHFSPSVRNSERLLEIGRPGEALAQLDRARGDARREDAGTTFLRGKILFAMLIEQLNEERWGSYGVNPNNWLAHPLADAAEKSFLDAMAMLPHDAEIRLALGNLYREQGRFNDSEKMLRSALEIGGPNAETYLALGILYAETDRNEIARRTLYAAWEFDKGNPKISKNIGYFYRFYEDVPQLAIKWFNLYFDGNPRGDSDINHIRAELRDLHERYPEFGEFRHHPRVANRGAGRTFTPRDNNRFRN